MKINTIIEMLLLVCLMATCFYTRNIQKVHAIDDAYITYRHVKNFLEDGKWVFNKNDTYMSSSTPLYMLSLTSIKSILRSVNIESVSFYFNATCDMILVGFVFLFILKGVQPLIRFLLVLPICFYPRLLDYSGAGMETSLFVMLMVSGVWLWMRNRIAVASILFGLMLLTRLESLIPIAVCWTFKYKSPRLVLLKSLPIVLVMVAPWIIYSVMNYDHAIPISVSGKINAGFSFNNLPVFIALLAEVSPASLFLPCSMIMKAPWYVALIGIIWGGFWIVWAIEMKNKDAIILLIIAFTFMVAYIIGSPPLYGWYQAHVGSLILISYLVVFKELVLKLHTHQTRYALAVLIILGAFLYPWKHRINFFPETQKRFTLIPDWNPIRESSYKNAALFIKSLACKEDAIFIEEVGTVGYFSEMKTLDAIGLTSLETRNEIRKGIPLDSIVLKMQPEWVIMLPSRFSPKLEKQYQLVNHPFAIWGGQKIYKKAVCLFPSPQV